MQFTSLDKKKILLDEKVIIFGTGLIGALTGYSLKSKQFENFEFYDSNISKQGKVFCGKKILHEEDILKLDKKTYFLIAHNYFNSTKNYLLNYEFKKIYDCYDLILNTDYSNYIKNFNEYDQKNYQREIDWYSLDVKKDLNINSEKLILKCIDIEITEKCSMKCANCANLMQYYVSPENSDVEKLFKNLDYLMNIVDYIYEFRILGGEPFMHKKIHKIIDKISKFKNYKNIVIYSNATIIPKNENLKCLQKDNLTIDITNYGSSLSKKHDEIIEIYQKNKINFRTRGPGKWTDNGKIKFYKRNKDELQRTFDNCCVKNTTTMLDGKIYRCPYAANATKLKAIPHKESDRVNLDINESQTSKEEMIKFLNSSKPLLACSWCPGRDYLTQEIEPAVQTKNPIKYKIHNSIKEKPISI